LQKQSTIVLTLLMFLLAYTLSHTLTPSVHAQNEETYINKPVYPVKINASQIPIGSNWTLVYNLQANTTYHAYCYGKWINNGSEPKTDYDIYAYNPLGELESYHTEAAGLPEHLGNNATYPFFTPKYSGNYSFVIRNDPRESQATEAASFMLIQHVETNEWYQQFIQGKVNDLPVENTSWAVEFMTASKNVEVKIQVPDTLDMYEARLYLMANPSQSKGVKLNNVSLAWEPGLYGNRSGAFGGYNLNSKEYRGLAYASCEYPGQDMLINYTSPNDGESLYHLVFIGEMGQGNINFVVKTDFQGPSIDVINPPQNVFPQQQVNMTFRVNGKTELKQVLMQYSNDKWNTSETAPIISNQTNTYIGAISEQPAGTRIVYNITITDVVDNEAQYQNSYVVKYATITNCTLKTKVWTLGRNTTISGFIQPAAGNLAIKVTFIPHNGSIVEKLVHTLANGTFFANFSPNATGKWTVQAVCLENDLYFGSESDVIDVSVVPESDFFGGYSMYLYAGVGVAAIAVVTVIVIRRRSG
jgi:hypothetical protein